MVNTTDPNAGKAATQSGQTIQTFLGSLGSAFVLFGVQFMVFYLLKNKFIRIYRPKTFLVPAKDRTTPPPEGFWRWIVPVFKTSNAVLISKCGLDAYFFLRFLRMLLKIFIPAAIVILPVLIPINNELVGKEDVHGLDRLGWQNFDPAHTGRLWAHLLLAILILVWTCYVIYDELRGYIRVRQAYLTSPQHRLRASATTVLVTAIPRKWLTYEALDGLYDVFPGGIRNIWINRNFDELNEKVKERDQLALMLENAETALIRNAKKAAMKMKEKEEKAAGKQRSKDEKKMIADQKDAEALEMAGQPGLSSGNPHQAHTVDEALGDASDDELGKVESPDAARLPMEALGRGVDAVRVGFGAMGQGIAGFGKKLVGGVTEAPKYFDDRLNRAYEGAGFAYDGSQGHAPVDPGRGRSGTGESQRTVDSQRRRLVPTQSNPARAYQDTTPETEYGASSQVSASVSPQIGGNPPQNIHETGISQPTSAVHQYKNSLNSIPTPIVQNPYKTSPQQSKAPGHMDWTSNGGFMQEAPTRGWKVWKDSHGIVLPSPEPKEREDAELKAATAMVEPEIEPVKVSPWEKTLGLFSSKKDNESIKEEYPIAFNEVFMDDKGAESEPEWKKYLKEGERDTTRLRLFSWMPHLPSWTFIGKKVDTIYYCRKELARLNLEIEQDQSEPEKFPLMNSAFIQFNHQIAAHMACQSVSHHVPNQMAPRTVEIAPGDVIWDNLSVKWWERFVRQGVVIVLIAGLILAWAVPVSAAGFLSNLTQLQNSLGGKPFGWIGNIPPWLKSGLQGVLPALFVAILFALLPIILRFLAKQQGVPTGMAVELKVQNYYFAFSFVQLFVIVTISKSLIEVAKQISANPIKAPELLATNIPKTSNFFFSYLLLQAFTISAGSLAQIMELVKWFILRPISDNTARQKFERQLQLPEVKWGTFFPVYTNLACIGLIFSVIAPLVMVFNIITFSMFWVAYRYQTLYVSAFKFDTGGLLFPKAVNQLFTGIYVMELGLIGLFLLVQDANSKVACLPQAIIMLVCLIFTVLFHFLLNYTFAPLYRYMPITLEDDAVRRDEEFERAQSKRWADTQGNEEEDIEDRLERQEQQDQVDEKHAESIELENIKKRRSNHLTPGASGGGLARMGNMMSPRSVASWADRAHRRKSTHHDAGSRSPSHSNIPFSKRRSAHPNRASTLGLPIPTSDLEHGLPHTKSHKHHHGQAAVGDALFGGFSDEIEDLTAEERDMLVQRAFQHEALRARRPVIWIPRDDLGISDDEIRRTQAFSNNIWISNEFTGLDRKARVVYKRAPPDFSEVDLIEL